MSSLNITNGIALASMEMASAKVANQAQMAIMKNVMDMKEEYMTTLLKSMGMGQNISIEA